MVLSGWTQAASVVKDDKESIANAGSTSNEPPVEAEKNDEIEITPGKKRKLSEVAEAVGPDLSSVDGDRRNPKKLQVIDDDDEVTIFDNWDSVTNKKIRMQ